MPLLQGAPLALPYYAVAQEATQEVIPDVNPAIGADYAYVIAGEYVEVVISVGIVFVTDGTAVNRVLQLQMRDADQTPLNRLGNLYAQGASLNYSYTWTVDVTQPYGSADNRMVNPLPKIVLSGGYSIHVTWLSGGPGDKLIQPVVTTMRFPTGGGQAQNMQPVAPPLLV